MIAPFFLVGFQRSGTTLLRLMLDHHPQLAIPLDTTGLWMRTAARLERDYGGLRDEADLRRLTADLIGEERLRLWQVPLTVDGVLAQRRRSGYPGVIEAFHLAYASAHGKVAWGDKDPGNMLRLAQVLEWFPDGRVLHIVRDGRDACLSQLEQAFGFDDCLACAEAWREQVWWVRQMGRLLGPARYWEVRYEDLVAEPERCLREAAAFLGVPYDGAMLEYHRSVERSVPEEKRHLWPKLGEPPRADNAGRWKQRMSRSTRLAFEKRARGVLRDLGYETLPGQSGGGYAAELASFLRRVSQSLRRRRPGGSRSG